MGFWTEYMYIHLWLLVKPPSFCPAALMVDVMANARESPPRRLLVYHVFVNEALKILRTQQGIRS